MKAPIATTIAIASCLLVMGGLLLQPVLDGVLEVILHLAIILSGVAVLIGIANLLLVHWMRIRSQGKKAVYSFVVIAAFLITLLAGILINPKSASFNHIITGLLFPIEASLMGLVVVSLSFACLTLIQRKKRSMFVYLFMGSALVFILLRLGVFKDISSPVLEMILELVENIPSGAIRGLLIGMALGSLITGIRILLGSDRPYAG